MIIYTKKCNKTDNMEFVKDFRISEKSCTLFDYCGMKFKILPKHINWHKEKTEKVNPDKGKYNTILVLCENDKWVYIANLCTKEDFIAKCEKCFNLPEYKHLYAVIVEEVKKFLSPLFIPVISE